MNYAPKMDVSPALDTGDASYFQSLIGILRWTVEIGHINIVTEVLILSSHLAYPQEGHLEAVLHVMGYIKHKHNSCLMFDPTYPFVDLNTFETGKNGKSFIMGLRRQFPPTHSNLVARRYTCAPLLVVTTQGKEPTNDPVQAS